MLATASRQARWSMLPVCTARCVYSTVMKLQPFDTLVSPMLSYRSEARGPQLLDQSEKGHLRMGIVLDHALQCLQSTCLRHIVCEVRKPTPIIVCKHVFVFITFCTRVSLARMHQEVLLHSRFCHWR